MKNAPIGIFDSGLGGLSVASEVLRRLPNERILYFADNAHVPYGEKPLEQIREYALAITGYLIERGAKAVVMACNMSSAVALDAARDRFPDVPVMGMIDNGSRAAVEVAGGYPVGVLATTGTVKSEAYVRSIAALAPSLRVVQQACPKFVPLVESGKADTEEAEVCACAYVSPLIKEGVKTIILGCTHYPYLRPAIESAAGSAVKIIDPAEETVSALENILLERSLLSDGLLGEHVFCTSGESDDFSTLGSLFLGRPIDSVERVEWGVHLGAALGDVRV